MTTVRTPKYIEHLKQDERLHAVIDSIGVLKLSKREHASHQLMRSIMSQQLSVKVASVIYGRFLELYKNKIPTHKQVVATPFDELRAIGLSNAKTTYIQNVAQYALDNDMSDERLRKMTNEEVIEFLLPIKGVGKWTVEMLLMFTLGRKDVFAVDDLGIQQAMMGLYRFRTKDKKKLKEQMIKKAELWSPYRTYACMYLWRYKDGQF